MRPGNEAAVRTVEQAVKQVTRGRSVSLPDRDGWTDLLEGMLYAAGTMLRVREQAADLAPEIALASIVDLVIAPAGDATKAALVPVLQAALASDLPAYRAGVRALAAPTHELVIARASRWCGGLHDFHPILDHVVGGDPAARARATLRRARGWGLVTLAASAVMLSGGDLLTWSAFVDGEALKMHAHYTRERASLHPSSSTPACEQWAFYRGEHALPVEEEDELVRRLEARGDTSIRALVEGVRALPEIEPGTATRSEAEAEAVIAAVDALPEPEPPPPAPQPEDPNRGRWPGVNDIPPLRQPGWGYGENETY